MTVGPKDSVQRQTATSVNPRPATKPPRAASATASAGEGTTVSDAASQTPVPLQRRAVLPTAIYPKASAPLTPEVCRLANERAERWRIRCLEARAELASAIAENQNLTISMKENTMPLDYADLREKIQESIDLGGDATDIAKTVHMWLNDGECSCGPGEGCTSLDCTGTPSQEAQ